MKTFFKYLLAAACLCSFAACDKDDKGHVVWDFWNYSVYFAVEDAETGAICSIRRSRVICSIR